MDIKEKLAALEDMMELDAGTLTPETLLSDIEEWDSLSALSYVVMMKDDFGKKVTGDVVRGFKTVKDIMDTME
ncbi:putative uncharacterized protein [Succinatimonas sp. CAG:777]|nr:putative uncharacterized protein [Succinatimonas sp. CAG:777]